MMGAPSGIFCPRVSVIVRAHEAADVRSALTSVFDQTFAGFEAIVVHDGSDEIRRLAAALAPYQPGSSVRSCVES
jgi:glycosyltransferase involved in cell wall biosynthesis